jgi:FkbM family methyltransferase
MLYNFRDTYVGRSLDLYGEYSEGEVELLRQVLQPGQFVVEAGANIGAHTVFLAQHVGPGGAVMAFEPQRLMFQTLCANLALNSIPNVICFNSALGAESGSARVPLINYWRESNFGAFELPGHQVGEQVAVITLDSLNLARCNLLKADVEGMELQVLQGATNLIARLKPILYVENDKSGKQLSLIRYIDALGYRMYWHLPFYFNPTNFFGNQHDIFPELVSLNMLCLPKDSPRTVTGLEQVQIPPEEPGD